MTQTLKIIHDVSPESPREWDNLGVMACWHRRYKLGDVQPKESPEEWLKENAPEGSVVLPLYLLDHSGLRISATDDFKHLHMGWDSGQVGWIVATPEKTRGYFALIAGETSKEILERARKVLLDEVKLYNDYLSGDVWGWVFKTTKMCEPCGSEVAEEEDSCFGFYGDLEESGLAESVPDPAKPFIEDAWARRG